MNKETPAGQAANRFDYDPCRRHDLESVGSILRRLLQAEAFGPAPEGVLKAAAKARARVYG